ncbi:transglycosylase SLT domain-containing protein [Bradyrhizobium pachyrhizi]|uniref:Transglycosylase SLT domain-containing protein n=1 Tax=Bradyrhizobium pachyrhizi TaxID=280333 RepID=A0A844SU30_9BRAD|nr:lytic transglycosylase domain-containing protein [Bradyrhizobium pachyrhizi]MVT66872.1 transglycosylase SLT domain-containing protein [Bradyrhizobium pachyrhizi]
MTRPATPEIKINEALTPVATPLGLYDRPATPSPSPLHGVAQALSSLSSDLASWGQEQQKEQQQADFLKGQADFLNGTYQGYAEGVRSGEIPASSSPWYQRGANQAMGAAAGYGLESNFAASYEKWDGKNDPNPQAFEDWFRSNATGSIKNNNPYFLKGLIPHLNEVHNRYHDKWQKSVEQNAQYTAIAGFGAAAGGAIDDVMQDWRQDAGDGELYKPDISALSGTLNTIRQRGYDMGMKREQIDNAVVDAIQAKTLQYRDPELLQLLENKSSAGPKLSDTPYGRDVKLKTESTLTEMWKKETNEARLQQEREDKLAANQAKASIVEQLLKDPKAPLDDRQLAAVQKVDGDFKLDIMKWRDQVLTSQTADDPRKVNQLFTDILEGGGDGMDKLMSAIRAGDVHSQDNVSRAFTFIKSVQDYNKSGSSILTTSAARMYISQLEEQGVDSKFSKNRPIGAPPVLTPEARQALFNYRFGLMQWALQNPGASVLAQEKEASDRGEQILRNFTPAGMTKPGAFTVPPSMQDIPQTSFTPQNVGEAAKRALQNITNPPQQSSSPPQGPAQTPAAGTPQGSTAPTSAQSQQPSLPADLQGAFTPDQLSKALAWAQRNGRPLEQVLRQWQRQFNPAPTPGNSPTAPNAPATGPRSEALPFSPTSYGAANVPPAVAAVARQVADRLGVNLSGPGGAPDAIEQQPNQQASGAEVMNSGRAQRILSGPQGSLIQQVAQANGMDPNKLAVMVSIESSGNPNASTGSYHGLLQLSQREFAQHGGDDIFDPRQNLEAGVKIIQQKERAFQREFGREPSATELYLMHQQGEAGLRAHERNPDRPAWENMLSTGEGRQKGEGWARAAVWGNVPSDMRRLFGSVNNITSREFMAVWTSKLLGIPYQQALAASNRRVSDASGSQD